MSLVLRTLLCLCLCLPSFLYAQSTVQLIETDGIARLSPQLKMLVEPDRQLSVQEAQGLLDQFVWQKGENPNYGFTEQGVWLYTTLSNVTENEKWVVDIAFSQLDHADFYVLLDDEIIAQSLQGKSRFSQEYRLPTVKFVLPYAQTVDLLIRIQSSHSSLVAPVDIQTHSYHERTNFFDTLIWGLFYGGLLILALYNLIIYLGMREPSVIAYVGYILAVILWQFVWSGHSQLIMSAATSMWINQHTDLIFVIIGIFSGVFTYVFLDIANTAPRSKIAVGMSIITLAVLGLCSLVNLFTPFWQGNLVYAVSLIAITSYTVAGFESYGNHFYSARYFIFAWSILATCALIGMLSLAGIFPSNFFTSYCFQMGGFLEAGLFSLALMDKSRQQLELEIDQATNDLRNNIELVEEQNVRLDIARKEAVNASNVKSQFLANMSHEIRTPLNAILGFSKELYSANLPREKQEQVHIIGAAADNLLTIVNDVLDFSKIEAGKLRINNHPFSPTQVIEDLISVVAKSAHSKGLEFVYDLSPLPEKLIGDSYRIKQILNNLLGNALKFTDHGYIGLSIKGSFLEHGMYELRLKIDDTGIGISREDRRKLFTAFSQVEEALSRSYQGTGLGLVICQELIKLMRGELTLQSSPGQGSTFSVSIRCNLLNAKLALKRDKEWQYKRIVYFDPMPQSRQSAVKLLKYLGADVTGVESLDFLRCLNEHYDLLFVCVPGSKERELPTILEAVRQFDCQQSIILYSATDSLSSRSDLAHYFNHKLRLPLTLGKLNRLFHTELESPLDLIQQRLAQLPNAKVLAVDDMEMNLRLLTTWFKPSKLQLTLAYSGKDAVAQCQQHEFDLILMDVQMPHMDGLEATRLIRQTPLNFGTPIIAVTAHAFKEEQDRLLASGMDDYLPKPIDLSDLIDLISRWCEHVEETPAPDLDFSWEIALKRSNHNEVATRELLTEFIRQLPTIAADIGDRFQAELYEELQSLVHQLHGACCYTGAPRLLRLCEDMESALKRKQINLLNELMPQFSQAVAGFLANQDKHRYSDVL